jgi:hypothetical protein
MEQAMPRTKTTKSPATDASPANIPHERAVREGQEKPASAANCAWAVA